MKRTALPPRRTPIRKVSTKRAALLRVYTKKRKAFLEAHPFCQVFVSQHGLDEARLIADGGVCMRTDFGQKMTHAPRATDIHHKAGRIGEKLNDESLWMAVSREAHTWLHLHPKEARARGWLI